MKKFVAGLVVGIVIATALPVLATETPESKPVPAESEKPIALVVNGETITLPDAQPRIVDGQIMVPVLAFSRVAGFGVAWDEANRALIVRTPQANTERKPAKEEPSLTIEVDGVTYYEYNSIRRFLHTTLPDTSLATSNYEIKVGNTYYRSPCYVVDDKCYRDLRPLVDGGVVTQEQIDAYYGK